MHIKGERLFSDEDEEQLRSVFGISDDKLKLVLDACCYTFEQAAFTSTGPEALYSILLEARFLDSHAKIIGRLWAAEAAEYVGKLKTRNLGGCTLVDTNFHMNLSMGQSTLSKLQEETALFELTLANSQSGEARATATEKVCIEFDHDELYSFFTQLEHVQQQLDQLSGAPDVSVP